MGFKRPFDDEEFQELPFKHSRLVDYSNKLTQFDEVVPHNNVPPKTATVVENEGDVCKPQSEEASKDETFEEDSKHVGPDFDSGAPFSCAVKSFSYEDGSGATTQSSLSQQYFELDLPRRTFAPFEDSYSFRLDRSPRKQVPLGPDHQASIPVWEGNIKDTKSDKLNTSAQNHFAKNDEEEKLMGTCIIPFTDSSLSADENCKAGEGRKDCNCWDSGSLRCVRQHVNEAREQLIAIMGDEKFVDLGFYDMGEEVANKWSQEEEQVFHETVYSNPFSLGRNFWKHLAAVFPSRTKKEIVSYYFNVFVLRRRAIQNRSRLLDIDSDDDEWHGGYGSSFGLQYSDEDEDSAIESPFRQDIDTDRGLVCTNHYGEDKDDCSDSENDGDNGCNNGMGEGCMSLEGNGASLSDDCKFTSAVHKVGKGSGGNAEELNVEDDSCTSFELEHEHDMVPSYGHINNKSSIEASREKPELGEYQQKCNDPGNHVYLFDGCDAKVWDARFSTVQTKGADLLPTRSIIEEIFGQGTWDKNTRNE